ncbi:MAG: baseplate J/gp47 family protein [Patescibacteria group bacterium]|nr:baseplate J/gp47 family protein [Patescibacteria group bacterium]
MDLKKFLPIQNRNLVKNNEEYFWALLIEPNFVQVGAWRVVEGIVQVTHISPAIAWESFQDLVDATDSALSSVVSELPSNAKDPAKTVFGVTNSWLADGAIKPNYLSEIKSLCEQLGLKPIGFVVLPEAIALYLKYQEHSSVSAVFIGCYKKFVEISVFKLGNLVGVTSVLKSVSLVEDVIEGLVRFSISDGIPNRFVLYGGKESELEDLRQDLLAFNWKEFVNLRFTHQPKVEVFTCDEKVRAVSLGGGVEIAHAKGLSLSGLANTDNSFSSKVDEIVFKEDANFLQNQNQEDLPPKYFGFETKSFDNSFFEEMHKNLTNLGNNLSGEVNDFENLGVIEHYQDEKVAVSQNDQSSVQKFQNQEHMHDNSKDQKIIKSFTLFKPYFLTSFFNRLISIVKIKFVAAFFVFLLVFLGFFIFWWNYPTAEVVIYVSPRKLEEKFQLKVVENAKEEDINSGILYGNIIKTNVSGRKTKETSGTKIIGEKAKGEVTLYRVGSQIVLKAGTILAGPGGLKFTLDDDVVVASGSASSPSESKVSVTAMQIGADYNLAAGASFLVSNYSVSDIEGKNQNAFSGGTSREVAAVTVNDHKELTNSLKEELVLIAKSEFEELLSLDEVLINDSFEVITNESRFSHNVGAEANSVELFLDVTVKALTLDKSKILDFVESIVNSKIPEGFVLRQDQIDFYFSLIKKDDNFYFFDIFVSVNLLPQVNPDLISQKIRGKYPEIAEEILQNEVPGYVRAEIKLKPKLPVKLGTLPQVVKNIDVQIASEK